ncbi:uncharacterized protein N7511_008126 [Penicillium nucicola]|uniref:uncharacterized protein n=1 Tax=Penicillium nucicola TaxID=1850975 RepID=UPI002545619C|nr:uncharacterized protein N7511_008126 [Penicillium nucicola]KAJ5753973.1 hypothetical protein N7511_008126 [Penicillium nucicola]
MTMSLIPPRSTPAHSRRFARTYQELDNLDDASLCSRDLGKVHVDCQLRVSKSKWGYLGDETSPAGIVYMDLSFNQPYGCRLASATVLVTLEDLPPNSPYQQKDSGLSQLHITKYFGPKGLVGEATSIFSRETLHLNPQFTFLGNGGGGIGLESERAFVYDSRWSFTGNRKATDALYRTLKWELCENELDGRKAHSSVINTGFAFQHKYQPFLMRVQIEGRLQSTRHRIRNSMRNLRFPPPDKKRQGTSETLIRPNAPDRPLDAIAKGLESSLEMENHKRIPVQVPATLPVTFENASINITPESVNEGNESYPLLSAPIDPCSEPIAVSDSSSTTLVDEPMVTRLVGTGGVSSSGLKSAVRQLNGGMDQQSEKPPTEPVRELTATDQAQNAAAMLLQYPALLVLMEFLAQFLNLFSSSQRPDWGSR